MGLPFLIDDSRDQGLGKLTAGERTLVISRDELEHGSA